MTLNFGQFTDAVKRADRGVTLWKHCSYGGNRVTKTSGAYRRARIGAQDNDISSLQVPSGMELTIFDRPDLKGKSKTFKGPTKDSCLVNDGWNDKLSSMIIKNTTGGGFGRESSKWKVAEVLFYNRQLSLDEITKVENYLMKKYKRKAKSDTTFGIFPRITMIRRLDASPHTTRSVSHVARRARSSAGDCTRTVAVAGKTVSAITTFSTKACACKI